MVKDARAASGPGALRPLNAPQQVRVATDASGKPVAVFQRGKRLQVQSVADVWRIEDEWWRGQPVARTYFTVVLEDGRRLTLFRDEVADQWYTQRYA